MAEVFELRPYFEWRGMGFISQSALRIRDSYAQWDAEQRFQVPGVRVTDPKAAQCGEVLKGVLKPAQCKLFGKECTPEHPVGALMVSSEGSCAAYYNYEHRKAARSPASASGLTDDHEHRCFPKSASAIRRSRWRTAPEARPAADWSKDCSRRCCSARPPSRWATPLISHINGTRIAITTDSFVVKPLRFPGGSIGELAVNGTVNDLAVSGARAEALVVTYVLEAGLPTEILEAEVRAMAKAAAARRRRSSPAATPKSSSTAKPTACTSPPPASAARFPASHFRPPSVRAGDKVLLSGPIGDHGITILLARGELDLEADLCSDTRSVLPLVEALAHAAGARHSLDARSHARRRRHVAE